MNKIFFILLFFICNCVFPQNKLFTDIIRHSTTSIKSQGQTGSCWAYASCSFFESELMRLNKGTYDLSEAFLVYYSYLDKGVNYYLRKGKASFPAGALSQDALSIMERKGILPQSAYQGEYIKDGVNDYFEMKDVLESYLDALLKIKHPSENWLKHYEDIIISYLGELPKEIEVKEKMYTSNEYAKQLGLDFNEYIYITSFSHHPFYTSFVLEVPDNYSSGEYYNVPLDAFINIIDSAIYNGYTVLWDGDVSEPTFSTKKKGFALIPKTNSFNIDDVEQLISQYIRQVDFERFKTTEDHLMHIIGIAKDKNDKKFYITKNSWGEDGPYKGYTYMSEAYVKLKTISIMLNKTGLPNEIKEIINKNHR